MGIPVVETGVVEEARSVLGSVISQIIAIIRQLISYLKDLFMKLMEYLAENPEYAIMLIANAIIFFS
jgi:hypothetical protein